MKSRSRKMFKVEPIGSKHFFHKNWNEKGGNMISNIVVGFNEHRVLSIQFSYFQERGHDVSDKYGSSEEGSSNEIIRLNHDEYVTGLSGIYWKGLVTSLTFHTNQRKCGPYCKIDDYPKSCERVIDVGIRDHCEFGGFFGSFNQFGGLASIGMYVYPRYDDKPTLNDVVEPLETSKVQHGVKTNYKVTNDEDDQLTLYQSSDPLGATINRNGKLGYQLPNEVTDGYHVKAMVHQPKFEDKISHYQSSDDRLAKSTNYQTLEYLMPRHVNPIISRKPKLKDGIFSKLGRLF
ncbi:PREDICTED: jacalin-related lectin 24-like [Camelina sativa]|uniref:Jacalin-related lectin 24-like n=1 Tax=Camelina sativa TaxID=90675 RepID=A0ABM0ZAS2_CAMSA|nr:PREDICTED: jacalin-related lectin 24-like [Camelina sativa]